MSKSALVVRDASGSMLYDTSKTIYGLIKSGPVEFAGKWNRYQSGMGDYIYAFRVTNAVSPVVFTVGTCGRPYQSKEGDDTVFYFSGPVSGLRVYCFDIMRPIFTGPALKTRDESSNFTFNSLQRPLNVKGTTVCPPPTGPWAPPPSAQVPTTPVGIQGGSSYHAQAQIISQMIAGFRAYYYDALIDPTRQKVFAAHIPWSRGCWILGDVNEGSGSYYIQGGDEGCSGIGGGFIRHIFWGAPETTYTSVDVRNRPGMYSLTVDPRPACMYIDTAEYPYPFNPQL